MDKIRDFAEKVSNGEIVQDNDSNESVKQEVLDGKAIVSMSVQRNEEGEAFGSWSVRVRDLLPDGKNLFEDYATFEEFVEDVGSRDEVGEVSWMPRSMGSLGEEFEELEEKLCDIIESNFGVNRFELMFDESLDDEYDIEFYGDFQVFE